MTHPSTVVDRLEAFIRTNDAVPYNIALDGWDQVNRPFHPSLLEKVPLNHTYGWHPPYLQERPTVIAVDFCADRIAAQVANLPTVTAERYLDAVEALIASSIAGVAGGLTPREALSAAEDELAERLGIDEYNEIRLEILGAT